MTTGTDATRRLVESPHPRARTRRIARNEDNALNDTLHEIRLSNACRVLAQARLAMRLLASSTHPSGRRYRERPLPRIMASALVVFRHLVPEAARACDWAYAALSAPAHPLRPQETQRSTACTPCLGSLRYEFRAFLRLAASTLWAVNRAAHRARSRTSRQRHLYFIKHSMISVFVEADIAGTTLHWQYQPDSRVWLLVFNIDFSRSFHVPFNRLAPAAQCTTLATIGDAPSRIGRCGQ